MAISSSCIHSESLTDTLKINDIAYWNVHTSLDEIGSSAIHSIAQIDKKIKKLDFLAGFMQSINRYEEDSTSYTFDAIANELKCLIKQLDDEAYHIEHEYVKAAVPLLMMQRDKKILANPVHLNSKHDGSKFLTYILSDESNQDFANDIDEIMHKGHDYNLFYDRVKKEPIFKNSEIEIARRFNDPRNDSALACNSISKNGVRRVVLFPLYKHISDINKLHTMLHELEHIKYNDASHAYDMNCCNTNHIADLTQETLLKDILKANTDHVQAQISRYQEFRSDAQAMMAIECPCCLLELALETYNSSRNSSMAPGKFHDLGYLESWQMLARLEELYEHKTICNHHLNNGKKIDITITDGSSLADRLIIHHNQPTPQSERLTLKASALH